MRGLLIALFATGCGDDAPTDADGRRRAAGGAYRTTPIV